MLRVRPPPVARNCLEVSLYGPDAIDRQSLVVLTTGSREWLQRWFLAPRASECLVSADWQSPRQSLAPERMPCRNAIPAERD